MDGPLKALFKISFGCLNCPLDAEDATVSIIEFKLARLASICQIDENVAKYQKFSLARLN